MTTNVDFNEAAARALEAAYLTTDVVEQRARVLRLLSLEPGQAVLDIGSGPGLLAREMADQVGPEGRVVGLDPSEPMLEMGRRRCADRKVVAHISAMIILAWTSVLRTIRPCICKTMRS